MTPTNNEHARRSAGAQQQFPPSNGLRAGRPSPILTRHELRRLILDTLG